MGWPKIGLLVVFVLLLTSGQILFKAAADCIKGRVLAFDLQTLMALACNAYLLLGLVVYSASTLLWVLLLRDAELSRAYLPVALAFVLVPLAGTFFFGEPLTARLLLGMAIILAGLAVALW
jgi:drug/metabolite transporter (DMT)-like permease